MKRMLIIFMLAGCVYGGESYTNSIALKLEQIQKQVEANNMLLNQILNELRSINSERPSYPEGFYFPVITNLNEAFLTNNWIYNNPVYYPLRSKNERD